MSYHNIVSATFTPLFRKGDYITGYLHKTMGFAVKSFYVGSSWSESLTSILPTYSVSECKYAVNTVNISYYVDDNGVYTLSSCGRYGTTEYKTSTNLSSHFKTAWVLNSTVRRFGGIRKFSFTDSPESEYPVISTEKTRHTWNTSYFESPSAMRELLSKVSTVGSSLCFLVELDSSEVIAFAQSNGRLYVPAGVSLNPSDDS